MKLITTSFFLLLFVEASNAQCYTVAQTTYELDSLTAPNYVNLADDAYSGIIPIGFSFCFYGGLYDSLVIGANGIVTFDTSQANSYCQWPIGSAIPSSMVPMNAIFLPWQDLYHPAAGTISYQLSGVSPNRKFTVDYDSVAMYGCFSLVFSGQVKLFETTNIIEIDIAQKYICSSWNGGFAIEGIQDLTGTMATVVPGRNYPLQWSTTNDSRTFTPICNVCSGLGITEAQPVELNLFVSSQNQVTIIPNGQDYKMVAVYTMLGQEVEFALTGNTVTLKNTAPGIYIVTLEVNGMRVVKKIMMN